MKTPELELEGTWDEIKAHVPDFAGKRLLVTVRIAEDLPAESTNAIDEALSQIWRTVPEASWERFPSDFGTNIDLYLYSIETQSPDMKNPRERLVGI